jgi:hypothetical protein
MSLEDDVLPPPVTANRNWRFDLILPLFIRPRATLSRIAASNRANWRAPILLLVLAAVIRALVAGSINAAANTGGEVALPPGFEFYTPEQMAQFQQAATATNTPTFNYILPALGAVLGVVVVWFIVGWLLHLVLTLLGGRGTSQATLNVAAWASLPFLLRSVVQIVAMLVTDQAISSPGISGFAPTMEGFFSGLLTSVLGQIDLYWVWFIILLFIGARIVSQLAGIKSLFAVLLVTLLVMVLRALPAAILAQFGDLTVIRPFF